MRKISLLLAFFVFAGINILYAQNVQVTGTVSSAEDGSGIPGATVKVKGGASGVVTDVDGKFSISVSPEATLIFSFVGTKTQEIAVAGQKVINVTLKSDVVGLDEVVVTALGISREKKSLGYATQEIKGDAVSTVKTDNFINSMSGKVSGVQIRKNTNIGGSTNILIRGNSSLTGNNQALFVIDGVPVSNNITNSGDQKQSGVGYDYGNAASDINPEDIESVNVLKGAAATALYGSRAANGVVMITTKKGSSKKEKGIGISFNSNVTIGFVDKKTFPEYQNQYGAGYGKYYGPDQDAYFNSFDTNGDGILETWVPTTEDASFGAKFDSNSLVYQWDAVYPESPNYQKATPWVAAKNGPITFFEHPVTYTNTIAIDNNTDKGSYRFAYTNYKQNGLLPNSNMKKNNFLVNGSVKVTDRLTASSTANFIRTSTTGRNSTGYNDNIMGSFRQWFETNVDIKEQKDAYFKTKRNITWNWASPTDAEPIYWDNPYWTRYENYESDSRNRFIGNIALDYKLTSWLSAYGRVSVDSYNELQEERRAIGSIATSFGIGSGDDGSSGRSDQSSGYLRRDISFSEYNYDFMLNFDKKVTDDISIQGILGSNIRRTYLNRLISSTNGGLSIAGIYSLQNSVDPLPYSKELDSKVGVNGLYGDLKIDYQDFLYLEGTLRRDHSSTLPSNHNVYYYPSVSTSFLFSKFINADWLSLGKVRLNYAEVGNSADFDQLTDRYNVIIPLNSPMTSVAGTKKDANLKPEITKSYEAGLEMYFFNKRIGFDIAAYSKKSINQIVALPLSRATGYNAEMINAGEIDNKGVDLTLSGTPIKTADFKWDINVNWSKNVSRVVSLTEGIDNIQLGSFTGGVTINARKGQRYGAIQGTDFVYYNGQRVVKSNGKYQKTTNSDNVIGNINPDWTGGVLNTFTYKNWSFSFLIDVQHGGDIFSLDMYYGLSSGLYKETAGTNDLGNPVRDPVLSLGNGTYDSKSGGYILPGVTSAGVKNTTRVNASNYAGFGYPVAPAKAFVYDASYIKLREVNISYTLPSSVLQKTFIKGATFAVVGSNLWIIHKNLPYADPESGLGAGNLQGYTTGSLPSTRDFGFDVKLSF
jgi:TonB-linked SusC/RagA family outer membrane protein